MTVHVEAKVVRGATARGLVYIHSCPRAVTPHVEWSLARVFGQSVAVDWAEQPIAPPAVRAEIIWSGPAGTGARLASALLAFPQARFEITEDGAEGRTGERFAATPALGLFRGDIGAHGDVMVCEDRLRTAIMQAADADEVLRDEIARLIGSPWDDELEPFRCAQEGSTVRVLHDVV